MADRTEKEPEPVLVQLCLPPEIWEQVVKPALERQLPGTKLQRMPDFGEGPEVHNYFLLPKDRE